MSRPDEYNWAAISLLIAGILNLWISAALFVTLVFLCVGVFWLFPMAVAVVEIVTAARMLAGHRVHSGPVIAGLGLVASLMNFNVLSLCGEVLTLVLCTSVPVSRWLEADPTGGHPEW